MKYDKPEVVVLASALEAVQSQTAKINHFYPDAPVLQTSAAYEADE